LKESLSLKAFGLKIPGQVIPLRATRDIDLLGFQLPDAAYLIKAFEDLCALGVDDGIEFDGGSIRAEEIRKEANYTGMRVTLVSRNLAIRSRIYNDRVI
jgi:hypothetical protein